MTVRTLRPLVITFLFAFAPFARTQQTASPITFTTYERARFDEWQWFAAPPYTNNYGYLESLLRLSLAQKSQRWDWQLELSQPMVLDAPTASVSSVSAQGQLGLGGTYYASNANHTYPAAAFLKQAWARYKFTPKASARLGRFEFFDGVELAPKDKTVAWLQANRISSRLISNFGFANAQRSFDGVDAHIGTSAWDVTAFAARADQGVFNMNGNPELNVDAQYLAFSRLAMKDRVLFRAFAIGYHDGRTGLTKTDNRPATVRATDHTNIRIGTYGANLAAALPVAAGTFDFVAWGALQNGRWGQQSHSANAFDLEGGYQFGKQMTAPWLRGGYWRSSGDANNTDSVHNTFFQVLPTPRQYARDPFYNLMNSTDGFVQAVEKPRANLTLRSDLHWLRLTQGNDFWYQGGGAFDNKVFGFTGRPGNGFNSFASTWDLSADWQATKSLALNAYYAHVWGKTVVGAIYPADRNSQFGYLELVYRFDKTFHNGSKTKAGPTH